jgi:enamine deaminase RidA (YjgF/YER057c/UK114 family)
MHIEAKLTDLGLTLPDPPEPVASYLPSIQVGDLMFLSGTTCYMDGEVMVTGRVGAEVTLEQAYDAARQTALNLLSVMKAALGDLDHVKRIVKLNGYVNSALDFFRQPEVINGASDLFERLYGLEGKHARAAIGVSSLPGNIPVEIELIVQVHRGG